MVVELLVAYRNNIFSSGHLMKEHMLFGTFDQKKRIAYCSENVHTHGDYTNLASCSFNGKAPRKGNRTPINQDKYSEEGDWESGFHCYGARYYWSELLTGWLSVDPMADKYPNISPYNYCAWNPIIFIDPDGEEKLIWFATTIPRRGYYETATAYKERIKPFKENQSLQRYANRFSDRSDVIHVFAHGNQIGGKTTGTLKYNGRDLEAQQFTSQVLLESDTYKSSNDKNPCVIMLHCCYSGQGEDSFAQKLSLGGNLVIAPSDACNIKANSDNKESVDNGGVWNVFFDGKKLTQLKGDESNTNALLNYLKKKSPAEIHQYFKNLNKHEE